MGGVDPYALLGVQTDASAREIRRAYRRLARQHHPDLNSRPDGGKRFGELARAYAILNDPGRRARYDQTHQRPAPARPPIVPRSPVVQRTVRRGTLELSVSEARQLVLYPLTLSDGRGRTITLPAGVRRGDEITLLYDGHPVVLTVQVEGLDRS
jgi:curved DNA-binding protein CbpA